MLDASHTSSLADLKLQRSALGDRLAALHAARDRLRDAEAVETEALAAIGTLGRSEADAAKAWATAGAVGDMPALDHGRRAELHRALAVASAEAEAARSAGAGLDAEIGTHQHEFAALAVRIELAGVAALLDQFRAERAELVILAADVRRRVGGTFAAIGMLRNLAEDHRTAGRLDQAAAMFRMLEQINGEPMPDFAPSVGEVAAAVPVWSALLAEAVR